MFTNNYYKAQIGAMLHGQVSNPLITFKDINGGIQTSASTQTISYNVDWSFVRNALYTPQKIAKGSGSLRSGVYFGNGTATPTENDYQLSGDHFTTYSYSYNVTYNSDTNEMAILYTLTNTGDTPFTVSEIGCVSGSGLYLLILHELLDSPVTIAPGGVGLVTLTIKSPQ